MLVHVAIVLEVPVTVVHMIDVTIVLDLLAVVRVRVRSSVVRMQLCLAMTLTLMDVIDVVTVLDRVAAVLGKVLVVGGFGMDIGHCGPSRMMMYRKTIIHNELCAYKNGWRCRSDRFDPTGRQAQLVAPGHLREEFGEPRAQVPLLHQGVVFGARTRMPRAHRPDQAVARRMRRVDELDHIHAIAD